MPNLTVMENIFVGREPGRFGFVDRRRLQQQAQELLDRLGVRLSPTATVRDLAVAEQQMVEIAKALSMKVQVIIMDEPTSALSDAEVQALFKIIRELKPQRHQRHFHLAPAGRGADDLRPGDGAA